ncbi:MAG TPA: MoaD/ThiS family protein [Novosphingobium sp.]|nr:MoaD/ThiS family protein [Novosphingobium sp.]
MSVRLVFLARLADLAGAGEREVAATSLETILGELGSDFTGPRIKLALNGTILTQRSDIELRDGDELAFLPPVSGG